MTSGLDNKGHAKKEGQVDCTRVKIQNRMLTNVFQDKIVRKRTR